MKKRIALNKSWFFSAILKLMGVSAVLVLFEACYGTPKSAFAPKHADKSQKAVVKSNTAVQSAEVTTVDK